MTRDTVLNFPGYLRNAQSSNATELCGCNEITHLRRFSQSVFNADISLRVYHGVWVHRLKRDLTAPSETKSA